MDKSTAFCSRKEADKLFNFKFFCFIPVTAAAVLLITASISCGPASGDGRSSGKSTESIEGRVRSLEDREEICRLILDYGRHLDRRDFTAFSMLFSENDGEWIGGFGRATGRRDILRLMEEKLGTAPLEGPASNFHIFSNQIIDLTGDRAAANTKWIFVVKGESGQPEPLLLGHYEDEFIRENGAWKFLKRVVYTDIPADNPEL